MKELTLQEKIQQFNNRYENMSIVELEKQVKEVTQRMCQMILNDDVVLEVAIIEALIEKKKEELAND